MSEQATPETDELLNTIRELECELAATTKARDYNRTCVKRLTQERDEAWELARELMDVLELYKIPYTDADLVILAESNTGMGEIGTTEAKREIIRRHLVNKAKEVLP